MKIGMVTQWYEPEPGAAAHPTAIARALHRRGHQVKVLTGFPNYPHGKVYDDYAMSLRQHEWRDGVELLRVPHKPSHDDNAVNRALSLTSFAASSLAQVSWLRDVDVCLVYLSPATVGGAARALKAVYGVPYVLYVQDLWPESVTASGFIGNQRATRMVERGIHAFLTNLYRNASATVGISRGMSETLAARGVPPGRAAVIYNWVDEDIFRPDPPTSVAELDTDSTWVMYAGGIGRLQSLDTAVQAIAMLSDRPHVKLALVGDGVAVPELREQVEHLGVQSRVVFLGHRPMAQVPSLMGSAAAQLVSLRDLPLFGWTVPSKLQASWAARQPVVCAVAGEATELVRRSGAGLIAEPDNAASLADAFRALDDLTPSERGAMGAAGRAFYLENMGASVGAEHFERVLADAEGERRR